MSTLREKIGDDLKNAMKARSSILVSHLRALTSKIKDLDVALRTKNRAASDDEIWAALRSMIKSRRESITLYQQGGRQDLVDKEEAEIATFKEYLPPEIDDEELDAAIILLISELDEPSMKGMGKVVAGIRARFGGALDMGRVSEKVKAKLA